MVDTHMFWAYGELSKLEIHCMASFLRLGYNLNVWSYGDIPNVAAGARIRNAREIIPETEVFLNKSGSYAGFSDLFRYALLSKHGGLWVDTDVIAIMKPDDLPKHNFFVTERTKNSVALKLNGNVIFNPEPCKGDVIDLAFAYSSRFRKEDVSWSEIGPDLLTAIISIYPEHGFDIRLPEFANPIDHWDCPSALLTPGVSLPRNSAFVHLYNDMWRRNRVDKNSIYPEGCLMDLVCRGEWVWGSGSTEKVNTVTKRIFSTPASLQLCHANAANASGSARPRFLRKALAELFLTAGRVLRIRTVSDIGEWLWSR